MRRLEQVPCPCDRGWRILPHRGARQRNDFAIAKKTVIFGRKSTGPAPLSRRRPAGREATSVWKTLAGLSGKIVDSPIGCVGASRVIPPACRVLPIRGQRPFGRIYQFRVRYPFEICYLPLSFRGYPIRLCSIRADRVRRAAAGRAGLTFVRQGGVKLLFLNESFRSEASSSARRRSLAWGLP